MLSFKPIALLFFLVSLATAAGAQDLPDSEFFVGYSFARLDIGEDPTGASLAHFSAHGWHLEFTRFLNDRLGIAFDASGHYKSHVSATTGNVFATATALRHHGFLIGPRVRLLRGGRFQSSFSVLVGIDRADATGAVTVGGVAGNTTSDLELDGSALAVAFEGSMDLRLNDGVSYRIVQPNYFITRHGNDKTQNNLRLSTGLVFTF